MSHELTGTRDYIRLVGITLLSEAVLHFDRLVFYGLERRVGLRFINGTPFGDRAEAPAHVRPQVLDLYGFFVRTFQIKVAAGFSRSRVAGYLLKDVAIAVIRPEHNDMTLFTHLHLSHWLRVTDISETDRTFLNPNHVIGEAK